MKYNYSICLGNRSVLWFAIVMFFSLSNIQSSSAQVRVPFKIRTSQEDPLKKNYSINGDFNFIGNTNLTLVNYDAVTNNNNNAMQYVDVDTDATTWNSSSANLIFSTENGAVNTCTNIVYAGLYWTGRSTADGANTSPNEFTVTKNINGTSVTKNFNKRKILFKGPISNSYSQFEANENAIYYPNNSDAFIYSAYTDVTEYVRQNGIGSYMAADIALVEGNGSGTGYSGGWGLVVIYENSKLKHRDITLFDGHAFVLNSTTNGYNLEVTGFNTLQTGHVGVKLGIMASEGDVGLNGDYFQIQKNSDLSFMKLHHSQNAIDNFFNSSITNTNRNPVLANNTGIDIGTFEISNENNSIIGNNQTATNFRYGTVGDTYAIFAIVLAVDSYLPQVENTLSISQINNVPFTPDIQASPGQEIELNLAIKNIENEPISDFKIVIPLPYNATYIEGSAVGSNANTTSPLSQNNIHFNPTLGAYGSLIWDFGTLPLPENLNTVLANLRFKIKATEDCYLLKNNSCSNSILINGYSNGMGAFSNVSFEKCPFILGKIFNGNCAGSAIKGPISIAINAANYVNSNCQNASYVRNYTFCNTSNSVNFQEIALNFPPESLFYNSYPITPNSIQYSASNPFPIQAGSSITYYAIPSNLGMNCVYPFSLTKCAEIIANSDNGNTINTAIGGIAFTNILSNDSLNGQEVLLSQVQLSLVSESQSGITLEGTNVIVAPGTPAGNYTLTYQICDTTDLTKCQQAQVNFTVVATQIVAQNNNYEYQCSSTGIVGNLLSNDTLNGLPIQYKDIDIILVATSNQDISINTTTGEIEINNGLKVGNYQVDYKICPKGNPTSFDIATINIKIVDTTPPDSPLLNDIIDFCSTTVPIPNTTDNCSGTVTGFTTDLLSYASTGEYTIHWTFSDEYSNSIVVEQKVSIKNAEDSIPGFGYVDCNLDNDSSLNIDLNSFLPEGMNSNGNWTSSIVVPNLNGSIFSPYQAPTGNYDFKYVYNAGDCTQIVAVTIEVNNDCFVAPACNLLVHNAFSPNNDGMNETFLIENIDQTNCFPTNSVEIYNRWGVLVFKTKQYDNLNRVFNGKSEGRVTLNESEQLPTGTYYYIIKYTDEKSNAFEKVGYVYLVM